MDQKPELVIKHRKILLHPTALESAKIKFQKGGHDSPSLK